MASKMAYAEPAYDDSVRPISVQVRIDGIRYEGDNLFTIEGVTPRDVNWAQIRSAIFGTDAPADKDADDLLEKIGDTIWTHDLRNILAERIKPA